MPGPTVKIKISYAEEYSKEDWGALFKYACSAGHDFDRPTTTTYATMDYQRKVVYRLLREQGVSALQRAREFVEQERLDREGPRRCPHCQSRAEPVHCHKCNREMCDDCISLAPDGSGKVCGLCYDEIAEGMERMGKLLKERRR